MDPGGIGALIGVSIIITITISIRVYDRCVIKKEKDTTNPLLVKKRSFKVKNLFEHIDF